MIDMPKSFVQFDGTLHHCESSTRGRLFGEAYIASGVRLTTGCFMIQIGITNPCRFTKATSQIQIHH